MQQSPVQHMRITYKPRHIHETAVHGYQRVATSDDT
jgi:hypothetical protein